MIHPIMKSFLMEQQKEALSISRESDLVDVVPLGPEPRQRYRLNYYCRGLTKTGDGVVEADNFTVGVYFPLDYWHRAEPGEVITLLSPENVFHPNIRFPALCPGSLGPGTTLTEIIYQLWEILSFQKLTMREDDALNAEACAWARRNTARLPTDSRPLKRRRVRFRVKETTEGE